MGVVRSRWRARLGKKEFPRASLGDATKRRETTWWPAAPPSDSRSGDEREAREREERPRALAAVCGNRPAVLEAGLHFV